MSPSDDDAPRWWQNESVRHHVYGVFQGGGAKGIAYVGALRELRDQGCWFKGVAGSSAGAIVAVFIAAGLSPEELFDRVPGATKAIRPLGRRGWLSLGAPETLGHFSTEDLRLFIERQIREQIGVAVERPADVTFRELFEITGIELNIVVLSAPDTPIVLNAWSAPDSQVSYAAVASSAIPVVMTPQVLPGAGALAANVVVDGGAWANYPTFVFKDPSVRAFYGAPALPQDCKVVGFVLQVPAETRDRTPRSRIAGFASFVLLAACLGSLQFMLAWFVHLLQTDQAFGWPPFLLIGGVFGIVLFMVSAQPLVAPGAVIVIRSLAAIYGDAFTRMFSFLCLLVLQFCFLALLTKWAWDFKGGMSLFFLAGIVASYVIIAFSAFMFRYGEALLVTGLPAARAAMRATTGVAEWAGAAGTDLVVRVPVLQGVGTVSFDLPVEKLKQAAEYAADGVRPALNGLIGHLDGAAPPKDVAGGVGRNLEFLTAEVREKRARQLVEIQEKKDAPDWRWGSKGSQITFLVIGVVALQCAAYAFAPRVEGLFSLNRPDPRVALGLTGALAVMSLWMSATWRALVPSRIFAAERRRACWVWFALVAWSILAAGATTQLLQSMDQPRGEHLLKYDYWYLSRIWTWVPALGSGDVGVSGPSWAAWIVLVVVAWASLVLLVRLTMVTRNP